MRVVRAWFQPFEIAFAGIIISQGGILLAGGSLIDPVNALLPDWMAVAFQIGYVFAGLITLIGILLPRGDVEGAGLVLLGAILLARGILFGQFLGWDIQSVTSLTFSVFLAGACLARLALLMKGLTLAVVRKDGDQDAP